MRAAACIALAALLSAGLAACFSSTSHQRRFYVLHLDPLRRPAHLQMAGVVRVRALDAESAYDRFQIVVRRSPYELEYRERDVWAVKPNQTVSDLIARALLDLQVFSGVTRELGEQRPDYVFSGDLHAIEVYDSGDTWFAHLALTLTLTEFSTGKRLWSFSFQDRKEVPSRTFSHATRALSEVLSMAVQMGLNDMGARIAAGAEQQDHTQAAPQDLPLIPQTAPHRDLSAGPNANAARDADATAGTQTGKKKTMSAPPPRLKPEAAPIFVPESDRQHLQ